MKRYLMERTEWVFYRLKHLTVGGAAAGTRSFRITRDEYFVTFRVGKPNPGITCEVASSASLPPSHALKPAQELALKELGFAPPGDSRVFTLSKKDISDESLQDLAAIALKVMGQIFIPDADSTFEFEFYHEAGRSARALQWIGVSFLNELLANGGAVGLLTLESGRVYGQFTFQPGKNLMYCELVSNQFLPKEIQLSPERLSLLPARGFQAPAGEGNFSRTYPTGDRKVVENAVLDVLSLFTDAYGLDPIPHFKVVLTIN
jgi:hypothetical protein